MSALRLWERLGLLYTKPGWLRLFDGRTDLAPGLWSWPAFVKRDTCVRAPLSAQDRCLSKDRPVPYGAVDLFDMTERPAGVFGPEKKAAVVCLGFLLL